MSRIPALKNLKTEDFPNQTSWIGKLLQPINQFIIQTYNLLNGQIEFGSNIKSHVKTLTVDTTTATYPIRFQSDIGKPSGAFIVKVQDKSANPTTLANAVFFDWEYKNSEIQIKSFIGLASNTKYEITIILI